MHHQKTLEESIEKMGVWLTKHPSGTIMAQVGGERFTIFKHPTRWTYRIEQINQKPHATGFFIYSDVDLMVHKVLTWAWKNGAQANAYNS